MKVSLDGYSAMRFYEQKRLIAPGRAAGVSLDENAGMFWVDGWLQIERVRLASRADHLERTIRQLNLARDSSRHAAVCPAAVESGGIGHD